ncbi:hypothetical protein D1007_34287 [Hordeum vulgare]|nr:hypothetical protein D1007_34287 [Hordeum vulgare]
MASDLDTGLNWSRDDYIWEEMELQRRALEEIAVRHRGRVEGGVIVLDGSNEDTQAQTAPIRSDEPGQGYNNDGAQDGCTQDGDDGDDDDDNEDDGYYTAFYELIDTNSASGDRTAVAAG